MRKNVLLVCAALLCLAITACSKTNVAPVADTESLPATLSINSLNVVQPNNIVILGGSTAWGQGASSVEHTWVYKLRAKLKTVDKKDTIINLAFPGYTTYHVRATECIKVNKRPEADTLRNINVALRKHPKLVIVSLPSNDINNGYNDEEILNNYKDLVATFEKENIPYILTSNQPRNFSLEGRMRLRAFTTLLAKTFPGHVIDYLNALSDSKWCYKPIYNCGDGVHPNDNGHNVIYNAFINYAPFKAALGMK
jgi:acyl-CoA thioesterase-1